MSSKEFSTLSGMYPVLTDEKLSEVLCDLFRENIAFARWEYVGEAGKGDSYLSEIIRIKIFGKTDCGDFKHIIQVVLKSIPRSVSRRITFRSDEFFKNEILFYTEVLPVMLKFQSTKNMSEPFDNYPKVFLTHCDGENDIICLEDATVLSFGHPIRQEGVNLEHCRVTYRTLAKFHALSFAMSDQEPKEFNRISNIIFETYYDERLWNWYETFWKRLCGIAIDAVEKEYPNSKYVEKLKEFAVPERYKEMIKAVQDRKNGVISHGDAWTNNFLYKYVNGRPVDAILIDFQLARCASPVLDISYFMYSCTTQDMREKHYDELLKYYYEVLSSQIRGYGSDPDKVYSWDSYMEEGDKKRNIDEIWTLAPFKTKEGRQREANNVKHCVDRGYI
ncbi:uncharacterized protein LOC134660915 isoform X2 [Cydia amplana]|uniref:uncharacterized protein LOC134660915 isoform X2 n=1 Tax=Cydia amplana TaxID=1869771 RepID=UPI002FE59E81